MIYIKDNFLPKELYESLLNYSFDFEEFKTPGESFWVKKIPIELEDFIVKKLEDIEGREIKNVLCFLREANSENDTDWRIHNDTEIDGDQPDRAIVLYIKSSELSLNGTAFWEHENYGNKYIKSNLEEFNRMLIEDSNDKSKWRLNSVVGFEENRLLSYPCEYFHSKYPNKYEEQRVVLVMFYKYK